MKGSVLHYHDSFYKHKKTTTWKSPARSDDYSKLLNQLPCDECLVMLGKKPDTLPTCNSTFRMM